MRVVVLGAGAIGSLVAARLAAAGGQVTLVARPPQAEALRRNGGVRMVGKTEGVFAVEIATALPAEAPVWLLLSVKTPDVPAAAEAVARAYAAPFPILALQNGLAVEATLAAALKSGGWAAPERSVLRGINSYGAFVQEDGAVRHAGDGEILLPEHPEPVAATERDRVAADLRAGGFRVRLVTDLPRELWRKALVNAAINPVTADLGLANGELVKDPFRGQAERLLREAQVAARLAGFEFTDAEADAELWRVVRATAANHSSMRQDLERGRRTEIDAISGVILATAERHGVGLASTRRAVERIHRKEAEAAAARRNPGPSQP